MANFSKKLASTVSAAAIVATSMSASLVSAASEFLPYAEALASKNVINKQSVEADYRLNDQITRAELAKVAANLGGYTAVKCTGTVYTDVNSSLGDLCDAIETLAAAKVISTSTKTFRPTANVTRAEMTKMILGALAVAPVSTASHKFADVNNLGDLEGFINAAVEKGIVNKAMNFRPNATGSRGEVFKIAAKAAGIQVVSEGNKTETKAGNVTVSVVGTEKAQHVPANASSVPVGKMKITATGGDVVLNNITVTQSNLGNVKYLRASLARDGVIIGNSRAFNATTREALIRLNSPITLKNGESVELDALITLTDNGSPNSLNQFAVTAVNGAAFSPVTLGLLATTSYYVGAVEVAKVKTEKDVRSGLSSVRILDVDLVAPAERDVTLQGFTVSKTEGQNLSDAIANVKVYNRGTLVEGAVVSVTSDKIIVKNLNTKVKSGEVAKLELRADTIYVGKTANDHAKYTLSIVNAEDVSALEDTSGFATNTFGEGKEDSIVISGIKITTSTDSIRKTMAPGVSSEDFLRGTIESSASFEVREFEVTANVTNGGSAVAGKDLNKVFKTLRLYTPAGSYDLLEPTQRGLSLNDKTFTFNNLNSFPVDAGKKYAIRINGTLRDDLKNAKFDFDFSTKQLKNMDNGVIFEHKKSIDGNEITVSSTEFSIRTASQNASHTKISSSTENVEIGRFMVEAKTSDVRVSQVDITNAATTGTKIENFNSLANGSNSFKLYDLDAKKVLDGVSMELSDDKMTLKAVFDDVLIVKPGTPRNLALIVNTKAITDLDKTFQAKFTVQNTKVKTYDGEVTVLSSEVKDPRTYTTAIIMPEVMIEAGSLDTSKGVAIVSIKNRDNDNSIQLDEIKILAKAPTKGLTDQQIQAMTLCLRNTTGGKLCSDADVVATPDTTVAGSLVQDKVFTFKATELDDIDAGKIITTGQTEKFEVYLGNAPSWDKDSTVSVNVKSITYKYNSKSVDPFTSGAKSLEEDYNISAEAKK